MCALLSEPVAAVTGLLSRRRFAPAKVIADTGALGIKRLAEGASRATEVVKPLVVRPDGTFAGDALLVVD
jgi:hypothetical protein